MADRKAVVKNADMSEGNLYYKYLTYLILPCIDMQ